MEFFTIYVHLASFFKIERWRFSFIYSFLMTIYLRFSKSFSFLNSHLHWTIKCSPSKKESAQWLRTQHKIPLQLNFWRKTKVIKVIILSGVKHLIKKAIFVLKYFVYRFVILILQLSRRSGKSENENLLDIKQTWLQLVYVYVSCYFNFFSETFS